MQSHTDIHTHPHTYTPMQWSDSVICSVGEGSDITWWPRVPVLLMISNDHWHYTQKQSWPRLTLSYSHSHPVKETWTLLSQDINGYSCFITHSPIHSVSKNGGSTHVYLLRRVSKRLIFILHVLLVGMGLKGLLLLTSEKGDEVCGWVTVAVVCSMVGRGAQGALMG